ncbi:MAG: dihydrolipoyl dehydrogenase [Bacteroidetes bacterium 4572_112]|nr:MAG: dihydrolipoyl dehydrogenase [Bacteroidetes bacterium 4572_112]
MDYDIIIIGSGPGGYVAAIRASQLGFKVAVVERAEVGGICLNWGCIPTKALLKSAQVYNYIKHSESYGVKVEGEIIADFDAMVERSRGVAANMSKGVQFLFKKHGIELIQAHGSLLEAHKVKLEFADEESKIITAKNIILATGARARQLPNLPIDGEKIIGYRKAMTLDKQPESMVVVGSGAIGSEFAHFYNSIGTKVTLVEYMPNIVPVEDVDASKALQRSFKKAKMKVMTSASVTEVDTSGDKCIVSIETKKGIQQVEADIVLSAVGVETNLEGLGLDTLGVANEKGKILVNDYYKTNIEGLYAIGDIVHGPALAHVASREGIICVERLAEHLVEPMDYDNIPGCTYTSPEVASVGLTEAQAEEQGYEMKIGKFPFKASGKATAGGNTDGLVKVIFDAKTDEWLGCSMVGDNVTEMIAEVVVARRMKVKASDIINAVHPHPTMSEAVMEAVAHAYGEAIHII